MKYYVQNVGSQTLGDELARLAREGTATEHPEMRCIDRFGGLLTRDLTEVSKDVVNRICRMAKSAGYQFVLYRTEDNLPEEFFSIFNPVRIDPFKEARINRRKLARKRLPKGLIRGSDLLPRNRNLHLANS